MCGSGSIGDGGGNREGVVLGVSVPRVGIGVEPLGAEATPGGGECGIRVGLVVGEESNAMADTLRPSLPRTLLSHP